MACERHTSRREDLRSRRRVAGSSARADRPVGETSAGPKPIATRRTRSDHVRRRALRNGEPGRGRDRRQPGPHLGQHNRDLLVGQLLDQLTQLLARCTHSSSVVPAVHADCAAASSWAPPCPRCRSGRVACCCRPLTATATANRPSQHSRVVEAARHTVRRGRSAASRRRERRIPPLGRRPHLPAPVDTRGRHGRDGLHGCAPAAPRGGGLRSQRRVPRGRRARHSAERGAGAGSGRVRHHNLALDGDRLHRRARLPGFRRRAVPAVGGGRHRCGDPAGHPSRSAGSSSPGRSSTDPDLHRRRCRQGAGVVVATTTADEGATG